MAFATSAASDRSYAVPFLAVLAALVVFAAIQFGAYSIAGRFEYPLDDVYIHLAMADGIAAGGYGVNAGEYASAASSPLYPYLLAPFSGLQIQRYFPLLINILALVASCLLWARIVVNALGRTGARFVVAVFGLLALNLPQLAFSGMEHTLHILATLAVVRGIQHLGDEDRVSVLLIAGMILGPMIRFEAMAISVAAALFLIFDGRARLGVLLGVASILPVVGFMYFLTTLGLDPLPNSVNAKLGVGAAPGMGQFEYFIARIAAKMRGLVAIGFALLLFLALINLLRSRMLGDRRLVLMFAVASFAGLGHLAFGQFGWMDRYEIYILVFLAAMLVVAAGRSDGALQNTTVLAVVAAMAICSVQYYANIVSSSVYSPRGISLQQNQMARFAHEYVKAPVGVNDLGLVVWRNPNYVLDLFGLASKEALETRRSIPAQGWGAPLAAARDVELVMIYDRWLQSTIGPDWVRLGELHAAPPTGALGDSQVGFYATSADAVADLRAKLDAFVPTLPAGATFVMQEAVQ
ncbi:hypothetical protein MUY35_15385 [Aliiroseovarius sp. S1339]|uniref:hypothetical protein n=1 Tax=Aliiroseovarius sp. S1339 TaxID=2936990 RepID=UPI0020BE7E70|nr:hypothetical protein [Aliiroseovarius sp. S1339]MCK8465241.1 hypothetical protein [Aliiroseovarius sp. S1339]